MADAYDISLRGDVIVATFLGHLDAADGAASASKLAALLDDDREIVFDVTGMTGYAKEARLAWQSRLWPLRSRIRGIKVVGGTPLIRVGASSLALFLRANASFVR